MVNFQGTKYLNLKRGVELENGRRLRDVSVAYETIGNLNKDKPNAILIFHALSGSAHVYKNGSKQKGWWDAMIGPNKPFDPTRYFIICSNILGSCYGTTGPSSINPETGKPYGLEFPFVSVHDMVKIQKYLIDFLGIKKLLAVTGGSLGGMQALEWSVSYPDSVKTVIPIATTLRTSAQNIAFHEVGRQAIYSDPNWNNGDYYNGGVFPKHGLSVARMVGHITYLSENSMKQKFGRRFRKNNSSNGIDSQFQVESYLNYKGFSFTNRFDANSYIYITKAIDHFDLGTKDALLRFKNTDARFLVLSFSSDWLYPSHQSKRIVSTLKRNQVDVSFCEIDSNYGHDAFLLPSTNGLYEKILTDFLRKSFEEEGD